MKPKANKKEEGTGHKARIAAELKASIDIDGKKQNINFNYDLTITVEQIEYAIRQIAGGIAQAADKIAKEGLPKAA